MTRSILKTWKTFEMAIALAVTLALFVASVAFYGLFWGQHKSIFMLVIILLVGPLVLLRRMFAPPRGVCLADLLLVAVWGCYVAMIPFAATALGAVNAALMWMALMLTYFFFAGAPAETRGWFQVGIILAAGTVAFMGLLSYTGVHVFAGQMLGDRLGGAFHYPNTTATILNMGFFAALLINSRNRWLALFSHACAVLCAAALILTMSRGGWITLALTVLIALWVKRGVFINFVSQLTIALGAGLTSGVVVMLARDYRGLVIALAIAIFGGAIAGWIGRAGSRIVPILALLVLLASGALGLYAVVTESRYVLSNDGVVASWRQILFRVDGLGPGEHRLRGEVIAELAPPAPIAGVVSVWDVTVSPHTRLAVYNIAVDTTLDLPFRVDEGMQSIEVRLANVHPSTRVVLANPRISGLTETKLSNVFHRFLPYDLAIRVSQLQFRALAEDGRVIFIRDGLSAVRERPFFGYGGGAWGAVYSSVQSFFYGSGRAHADFIDLLLEIGIVGYLLLLVFFALHLLPLLVAKEQGASLALGVSASSLLIHSFGEATIAFPVLYFWLFGMLGILRLDVVPLKQWGKCRKASITGTVLLALAVAVGVTVSAMIVVGDATAARAADLDNARQREQATVFHRHSVRLNPWHATRKADLVLRLIQQPNAEAERRTLITSALRVAPFDPRITSLAGMMYFRDGDYFNALDYYRRTIVLQPLNPATYVHASFVAVEAALSFMPLDRPNGEQFAMQALEIHRSFNLVIARTDPQLLKRGVVPFVESADLRFEVGRALMLLGRFAEAEVHLRAAILSHNPALKDRARIWMSHAYRASGQQAQALAMLAAVTDKVGLGPYMERIDRALGR